MSAQMTALRVLLGSLAFVLATCLGHPWGVPGIGARAQPAAEFVGGQTCVGCHAPEAKLWAKSHHALAMQQASAETVLGDFTGATFEQNGVASTFTRDGDKFMVRTEGPDGALHDYQIAYTFGVAPLQQYLIAMPGGRLQAFGIAWDTRGKEAGGQRWFALTPDRKLAIGDPLHWTGRDQTWNYMCADCHSTNLRKNYDLASNSYATTWSDLSVSCESCHGPGSRHVAWAASRTAGATAVPGADDLRKGIVNWLRDTDNGTWEMNADTGIARRNPPRTATPEIDTCGGCHALRGTVGRNPIPGSAFLNTYLPTLLETGQYHADGQIDGEVFEYGSFLQSRMHRAGVTCTNCHEPHGLGLRADGNAVCAQCHLPAKFDVAAHHHHTPGSTGAQCAACHMPQKTYMQVHVRHDHSFRVPRPDLTATMGTPNTCNACHTSRTAEWAAKAATSWYPNGRGSQPHFGTVLHAGRIGAMDAERQLSGLIGDPTEPGIARATALAMLPGIGATAGVLPAWRAAITDPDPLVRMGAVRGLPVSPSAQVVRDAMPLLSDPIRAVRVEAARHLAGVSQQQFTAEQRSAFNAAMLELIAAESASSDRPESHLNLGLLHVRRGAADEAEAAYRTALRLDPKFVPAMVNLADLDRARGRDEQGIAWLRQAMAIEPRNADIHHSLGLSLVRQRNYGAALPLLREASELAPDNARYAYVYAIALNSTGSAAAATALLERTHQQHPTDRDVLVALFSIARDKGDRAAALGYARALSQLSPTDIQLRLMIRQLEQSGMP